MNRFTSCIVSVLRCIASGPRTPQTAAAFKRSLLSLEAMDERCMPSASPLVFGSTHEFTGDTVRVSHEDVQSKMSKMDLTQTPGLGSERKH
jgi:hypothetical protein